MIFDSSVWVEFLHKTDFYLAILLRNRLMANEDVFICPPIVQEVLQGIKSYGLFNEIQDLFSSLEQLPAFNYVSSIEAAKLYRSLRKKGTTIRKPNDCLIAWYAIHHDLTLVHNDQDFDLIAEHTPLKTYQPG
ncbi:MAG: PIN domain-containing protein [Cyclobacteriaceae bacterium]